jgi:hypothetical protein
MTVPAADAPITFQILYSDRAFSSADISAVAKAPTPLLGSWMAQRNEGKSGRTFPSMAQRRVGRLQRRVATGLRRAAAVPARRARSHPR